MGGLHGALTGQKAASGRGIIPSIWRATILEQYSDGTVSVTVPALLGDRAVRIPCVYDYAEVGMHVLVAAIEGRINDLMVITRG